MYVNGKLNLQIKSSRLWNFNCVYEEKVTCGFCDFTFINNVRFMNSNKIRIINLF